MRSGSRSRRTIVRITPRLFRKVEKALPIRPGALIFRGLPCLELIFNSPLDEEEKEKLKRALREELADEFDIEIRDE